MKTYLEKTPKVFTFDDSIKPKTHLMLSNKEENVSFIFSEGKTRKSRKIIL